MNRIKRNVFVALLIQFVFVISVFAYADSKKYTYSELMETPVGVQRTNSSRLYFYDQLDDTGKVLYKAMMNADYNTDEIVVSEIPATMEPSDLFYDTLTHAQAALLADQPMYHMYMQRNNLASVGKTSKGLIIYITIGKDMNKNGEIVGLGISEEVVNRTFERVDELVQRVSTKYNRYDRLYELAKIITLEMEYDESYKDVAMKNKFANDSVMGCTEYGYAVCAGFADLIKVVCDRLNIPCVEMAIKGHAWNAVQMDDGKWYSYDATMWVDEDKNSDGTYTEDVILESLLLGTTTYQYVARKDYHEPYTLRDGTTFSFPEFTENCYGKNETKFDARGYEPCFNYNREGELRFIYEVNADGKTCTITDCEGEQGKNLVIPSEIDGYTVTAIGDNAFYALKYFTNGLYIPKTVVKMGKDAFKYCLGITDVYYEGSMLAWQQMAMENITKTSGVKYHYNHTGGVVQEHVHSIVADPAVAATYSASGYTEGSHCSSCGEIIKAQTKISRLKLPFTDVADSAYYRGAVGYMLDRGIMNGTSDTTFSPSSKLTRGQVVVMLWNLEGQPKVTTKNSFPDVSATKYYAKAVEWAKKTGVVSGYKDGTFGPTKEITRQEFIIILRNFAGFKGIATEVTNTYAYKMCPDYRDVSSFAVSSVQWGYNNKLIGGGGMLKPKEPVTRADAAVMLERFLPGAGL